MARIASTTMSPPMTTAPSSDPSYPPQKSVNGKSEQNGINNSNHIQESPTRPGFSRSLEIALETAARTRRGSSEVSESDSLEDYDTLKPDPMSIITGGKGGGLDIEIEPEESIAIPETVYAELKIPLQQSRQGPSRRKSIPLTLNKVQKDGVGRYTFEADDDELRDLLKSTVAHYSQDNIPGGLKKRTKFSDCEFYSKTEHVETEKIPHMGRMSPRSWIF